MAHCILHGNYEPTTAVGCPTCISAIVISHVGLCGCDGSNGCGHRADLAHAEAEAAALRGWLESWWRQQGDLPICVVCARPREEGHDEKLPCGVGEAKLLLDGDAGKALLVEVAALREVADAARGLIVPGRALCATCDVEKLRALRTALAKIDAAKEA